MSPFSHFPNPKFSLYSLLQDLKRLHQNLLLGHRYPLTLALQVSSLSLTALIYFSPFPVHFSQLCSFSLICTPFSKHFIHTASPSDPPTLGYQQSLVTTPLNFDGLTAKSFGYVFNVRTTPTTEGGPILINGLDFYTITPGVINYELWSKLGSFVGSKGKYDEWEMVSSGSITGSSGPGGVTPIPREEFTPVEIPGGGEENGGVRAFYLTLNTNDLIYRQIDEANEEEPRYTDEADKRLHDENSELEIWEGEAVLNYPFPDPVTQAYFYRSPMEFVGVLHYDRKPNRTPAPTVPKVAEPTGSPSNVPTTGPPTKTPSYTPTVPDGEGGGEGGDGPTPGAAGGFAITPPSSPSSGGFASTTPDTPTSPSSGGFGAGFVLVGDEDDDGEEEDGSTSSSPAGEGTLSPTITTAPTSSVSSPTVGTDSSIAVPNVSQEDLIKANIVMTLRYGNGKPPDRLMFVPEVEAFLFALTTFFNDRTTDTMVLEGIGLFMQEFVLVDKVVPKKDDNIDEDATAVAKAIAEQARAKRQRRRYEQEEVPQINAMQLQVVLRVIETSLPQEVLGNLAAITIRENEGDLLSILKNLSGPYPYFAGITSVEVYAIDELVRNTPPPASADVAQIAAADGDGAEDGGGGSNVGMISGIVVGLFLVAGVAAGFVYQRKRKARINEIKEDDLEQGTNVKKEHGDMRSRIMEIMRSGKATPLNKSDSTNNSLRSIPNGSDSPGRSGDSPGSGGADESDRSDESNRSSARKRKGRDKKGVSKSLTGGDTIADLMNITSKMNHSDVTTDKEREQVKDILEQDLDASDRSRSPSRKKSKKELKKEKKRERKEKRKAKERASMEQEEAAAMAAEAQQLEEMEMMDREMREAQQLELQKAEARALSAVRNSQDNLLNAGEPLKNSMSRPTSQDNLKRSMRRTTSRNNLRNSNTSSASGNNNLRASGNNTLRKSLVDMEFEAALAEEGFGLDLSSRSSDKDAPSRPRGKRGDQRGSLRKSATQNVNGRGSMRKSSSLRNVTSADDFAQSDTRLNSAQTKKKTRRPKNGFSQSMVITSGNAGFDLGLDLDDDLGGGKKLRRSLNEDDKKLRQSQIKKTGNANLDLWKQSVKKDMDMRRSGTKVDGLDSTDDIANAFGKPKRQGKRGERPLSESVNKKDGDNARRRSKGDVANANRASLRKSTTDGANRASLRKSTTRSSNEDFARSDTEVLRGSGNKGSKRPGLARANSDRQVTSRPRGGNGERASLRQSVRKSDALRDSGNTGLRKSVTKGSSDNLRSSGNGNTQSVARKRGSERQSPRNSQTNIGGDQKLARQARASDRRRLSQSMTARTSEMAELRRSARGDEARAGSRNRPRGDSFDARGDSAGLRRSTTGRGGQAGLKRSGSSRRVTTGESGISDLKRSMIL